MKDCNVRNLPVHLGLSLQTLELDRSLSIQLQRLLRVRQVLMRLHDEPSVYHLGRVRGNELANQLLLLLIREYSKPKQIPKKITNMSNQIFDDFKTYSK